MLDVNMGGKLVLSAKSHIALGLALIVGTHKVSYGKVSLQSLICLIVHILVVFTAQMACKMHSIQMINEYQLVEEVFFAEIAPRVRQDLSLLFSARVSMFDMLRKLFAHIVESLLSDKHQAALHAYFAESLLVLTLQVLFKRLYICIFKVWIAIVNQAMHLSQLLPG